MPEARPALRLGLLGYGAINRRVAQGICEGLGGRAVVTAAIVQRERERPPELSAEAVWTAESDAFHAAPWDVCIEGAGQPSVRQHACRTLVSGRDFLVTSIGALTDDALYAELQSAADRHGSQLLLASGAMPAVDWMSGAALAGDPRATMTMTKPPTSG